MDANIVTVSGLPEDQEKLVFDFFSNNNLVVSPSGETYVKFWNCVSDKQNGYSLLGVLIIKILFSLIESKEGDAANEMNDLNYLAFKVKEMILFEDEETRQSIEFRMKTAVSPMPQYTDYISERKPGDGLLLNFSFDKILTSFQKREIFERICKKLGIEGAIPPTIIPQQLISMADKNSPDLKRLRDDFYISSLLLTAFFITLNNPAKIKFLPQSMTLNSVILWKQNLPSLLKIFMGTSLESSFNFSGYNTGSLNPPYDLIKIVTAKNNKDTVSRFFDILLSSGTKDGPDLKKPKHIMPNLANYYVSLILPAVYGWARKVPDTIMQIWLLYASISEENPKTLSLFTVMRGIILRTRVEPEDLKKILESLSRLHYFQGNYATEVQRFRHHLKRELKFPGYSLIKYYLKYQNYVHRDLLLLIVDESFKEGKTFRSLVAGSHGRKEETEEKISVFVQVLEKNFRNKKLVRIIRQAFDDHKLLNYFNKFIKHFEGQQDFDNFSAKSKKVLMDIERKCLEYSKKAKKKRKDLSPEELHNFRMGLITCTIKSNLGDMLGTKTVSFPKKRIDQDTLILYHEDIFKKLEFYTMSYVMRLKKSGLSNKFKKHTSVKYVIYGGDNTISETVSAFYYLMRKYPKSLENFRFSFYIVPNNPETYLAQYISNFDPWYLQNVMMRATAAQVLCPGPLDLFNGAETKPDNSEERYLGQGTGKNPGDELLETVENYIELAKNYLRVPIFLCKCQGSVDSFVIPFIQGFEIVSATNSDTMTLETEFLTSSFEGLSFIRVNKFVAEFTSITGVNIPRVHGHYSSGYPSKYWIETFLTTKDKEREMARIAKINKKMARGKGKEEVYSIWNSCKEGPEKLKTLSLSDVNNKDSMNLVCDGKLYGPFQKIEVTISSDSDTEDPLLFPIRIFTPPRKQ